MASFEAIRASAGSGKTYELTTRYVRALEAGAAPEVILAATFTRKAAGEILERVLLRLAKDAGSGPAAQARLVRLCRGLHQVQISTLDSFFSRLSGCFHHRADLPPDAALIDGRSSEAAELRRDAIRLALLELQATTGEEKERAELQALLDRVNRGEAKRSTAEALDGLLDSLHELYQQAPAEAWQQIPYEPCLSEEELVVTLDAIRTAATGAHSTIARAVEADLKRAESGAWDKVLGTGLTPKIAAGECAYSKQPIPEELQRAYEPLIRHARNSMLNELADRTEATGELVRLFGERYDRLRLERRQLLFSDVPRALIQWAQGAPSEEVAYRLNVSVDHLLLDEFQDTAPDQWSLLEPFVRRVEARVERGGTGSIFCVGDVKQAIYGWRGGTSAIFDRLDTTLTGIEWDYRDESWRSSPVVLNTVNEVFRSLCASELSDKYATVCETWRTRYNEHRSRAERTHLPGYAELYVTPAPPAPLNQANGGGEEEEETPRGAHHLDGAAGRIAEIAAAAPWATVGVLVRRNETARDLLFRLRALDVPASGEGGSALDDDPGVEAVLSALTLADHPGNTAAAFHVASSPLGALMGLTYSQDDESKALKAARVASAIRRRIVREGLAEVLAGWSRQLAPNCDPRGVRRLTQLVELAETFQPAEPLRPSEFVRHVRCTRVEEPLPARVRVMSIHASKGLEFDIVALPELTGSLDPRSVGPFPSVLIDRPNPTGPIKAIYRWPGGELRTAFPFLQEAHTQYCDRRLDEDLCVLYVAMTRARHALHLIVPPIASSLKQNAAEKRLSAAKLLRAALTGGVTGDEDGGTAPWSSGDPAWHQGSWAEKPGAEPPAPAPEAAPINLLRTGGARKGFHVTRPSELSHGEVALGRNLLSLDGPDNFRFGTLIHGWFSRIPWLAEADVETIVADTGGVLPPTDGLEACAERFRAMLAEDVVQSVLAPPLPSAGLTLDPPWIERSCYIPLGDRIISGVFDRVLVWRDAAGRPVRAHLFDWKTDGPEEVGYQQPVETYAPQLREYAAALQKMLKLPPEAIRLELVFVGAPQKRVVVDAGWAEEAG